MSTIEKAVNKLGDLKPSTELSEKAAFPAADALEKVVAERSEKLVSVEPDASALEALAKNELNSVQSSGGNSSVTESLVSPAQGRLEKASKFELQIPLEELAAKGMLTPLTPSSHLADEFRTIKRPLLQNIGGNTVTKVENANLIMVTSALQGDGKTFTALNLAMSIAMEQDKTVLFVDADVAKASAGNVLGIPHDHPGLIDVLENKGVSVADVIMPTSISNLRLMPAGVVHERSTELLASENMRNLMQELSSRYSDRVIIFDSPPLLLTTEASVLASFMGQIVFVASTDQTPAAAVSEALEHIGDDKIIGMVLNRAHARRNKLLGLSYGSGYGYGYGYGYGHEGRSASNDAAS